MGFRFKTANIMENIRVIVICVNIKSDTIELETPDLLAYQIFRFH